MEQRSPPSHGNSRSPSVTVTLGCETISGAYELFSSNVFPLNHQKSLFRAKTLANVQSTAKRSKGYQQAQPKAPNDLNVSLLRIKCIPCHLSSKTPPPLPAHYLGLRPCQSWHGSTHGILIEGSISPLESSRSHRCPFS